MFFKVGVLKDLQNFTGKHMLWSLFLINLRLQLCLKETPTQVFSCEISKIFKGEHLF